jgi:deoxycytidylate deaminase
MDNQSNQDIFVDKIDEVKYGTINAIFDQREKYIIIGLTGKVGSGCSTIANLFQSSLEQMNLSYNQPGIGGLHSDQEREQRVLQRFYSWHQREFLLIKVRDVILSFLLNDSDTWNEFLDRAKAASAENYNELEKEKHALEDRIQDDCEQCQISNDLIIINQLITMRVDNIKCLKLKYDYVKELLPEFGDKVHKILGDSYTEIFQYYGNQLRFFGTTMSNQLEKNLSGKSEYAKLRLQNATQTRDPKLKNEFEAEYLDKEEAANTIYVIAERINRFIKVLEYPQNQIKKRPIAIVIDSIKNIYESNYLKERYTAYYLISVSRDEQFRQKEILRQKAGYSQKMLDFIDYNERPKYARKKIKAFARIFLEIKEEIFEKREYLKNYLDAIALGHEEKLLNILMEQEEWKAKQEELNFLYLEKFDEEQDMAFQRAGISKTLEDYYIHILKDPLRVFLYVSGLYPFFLQDVETCIQNADIFLANNEASDEKMELCQNIVRYLSLMMHPGLVPPTPVERCMQIAYTAKVNSGCISRQVGAVVTDSEYQILSLGWNDVPCGQTSCVLRNMIDINRGIDPDAYSEYEIGKSSGFKEHIRKYSFRQEIVEKRLRGLPASYCFKDINQDYTGNANPMEARSMHGEEKALLLCDQERVKGGYLFTTSSPCVMCSKNAKEHQISKIFYIEPYPGISQSHVCNSGANDNRAQYVLFEGAIGRAYTQLYTPVMPYKDELKVRGIPEQMLTKNQKNPNIQPQSNASGNGGQIQSKGSNTNKKVVTSIMKKAFSNIKRNYK